MHVFYAMASTVFDTLLFFFFAPMLLLLTLIVAIPMKVILASVPPELSRSFNMDAQKEFAALSQRLHDAKLPNTNPAYWAYNAKTDMYIVFVHCCSYLLTGAKLS